MPGQFNAPGSKYSSILYMNPKASFALINPETMKSDPTRVREVQIKYRMPENYDSFADDVSLAAASSMRISAKMA